MINDNVVRLRGLPYDATKEDVANFFGDEFDIVEDGILLPLAKDGRSSGQAYVQFTNDEDAKKALEKNRQHMGHRYVEVFESSMEDAFKNQNGVDEPPPPRNARRYNEPRFEERNFGLGGRPTPYDRPYGYGRGYGPNGKYFHAKLLNISVYHMILLTIFQNNTMVMMLTISSRSRCPRHKTIWAKWCFWWRFR